MVAGQHGGHDRGQPQGVVTALRGGAVQQRAPVLEGRDREQAHSQHRHGIGQPRGGPVHDLRGLLGQRPVGASVDGGCVRRQRAVDLQGPDVLQRAGAGQLGRVVLAVVVEALLAPHRAELRVGDGQALQSRRCDLHGCCSFLSRSAPAHQDRRVRSSATRRPTERSDHCGDSGKSAAISADVAGGHGGVDDRRLHHRDLVALQGAHPLLCGPAPSRCRAPAPRPSPPRARSGPGRTRPAHPIRTGAGLHRCRCGGSCRPAAGRSHGRCRRPRPA